MKDAIYLDNHTVAPPSSAAIEAMLPFFREHWGSPLALHQKGQELFAPIDQATSQIYEAIGANFEDRFILASNGAEAIGQLLISTYIDFTRESGRNHFLVSAAEDPSILHSLQRLTDLDCSIKLLPVDNCGRLRPETLEEAIKPRAIMLSLSWANPLTGVIQPIADLVRICRDKGIRLHVDASAVFGKLFFRFEDSGIDYLTFDGALFHAPKGTGGLFARKDASLRSMTDRAVQMHVGPLVALSVAMQEALQNFDAICTETARLRDKLEAGVVQVFPEAKVFFQEADRLPNTAVIAFPGVHSEALLYALNRRGVYASTQKLEPLLRAIGVDAALAASSVSFALSTHTKEEEIDRAVAIISEVAYYLRAVTGELL